MPIYEYECKGCHHTFDLLQKVSDEPVKKCPLCENDTVTRLVSAAGFQLKGTGWYATDFKDKEKSESKASHKAATTEVATQEKKSTDTTIISSNSKGESD